jgi:hypothetical protein
MFSTLGTLLEMRQKESPEWFFMEIGVISMGARSACREKWGERESNPHDLAVRGF